MLADPNARVAVFAAVFAALFVAHQLADHWLQGDHQACTKGAPGWAGRRACAAHALTHYVTSVLALFALRLVLGVDLDPVAVCAGLTVSTVTHYVADRRTPLRRLALLFGLHKLLDLGAPRPGRDDNPSLGTGVYALDQSFHYLWLFVAALIIAA